MKLHNFTRCIVLLAYALPLAACGYEEGFEYNTSAQFVSMHDSGVRGTVTIGYGISVRREFRMRVKLHGLSSNVTYQVRFFDTTSCDENVLAKASRIDAPKDDPGRAARAWGFATEPLTLTGNFFGFAHEEFKLDMPTASGLAPAEYPAVVIYASKNADATTEEVLERVACAAILSRPTNHRPHM